MFMCLHPRTSSKAAPSQGPASPPSDKGDDTSHHKDSRNVRIVVQCPIKTMYGQVRPDSIIAQYIMMSNLKETEHELRGTVGPM